MTPVNLLVVGQKSSWLINASTQHKGHFVGTWRPLGLVADDSKRKPWSQLKELVLRHAAPGSVTHVYLLKDTSETQACVAKVRKSTISLF